MIDRAKYAQIRDEILAEKGELTLFALFLREGVEDRWDLIVSAPWLERDEAAGLKYVTKKLVSKLSERELLEVSRVVIMNQADPALRKLLRVVVDESDVHEFENIDFGNLSLDRAVIFGTHSLAIGLTRRGA